MGVVVFTGTGYQVTNSHDLSLFIRLLKPSRDLLEKTTRKLVNKQKNIIKKSHGGTES